MRKIVLLMMLLAAPCFAQCTYTMNLVPDGRLSAPIFVNNATDPSPWFNPVAGHSYSIEVLVEDDTNSDDVTATVGDASVLCPTSNVAGLTDTHSIDPRATSAVFRGSFTAGSGFSGGYSIIRLHENSSSSHYATVSITDTTMTNPRWSTYSGFSTQWGFFNTSSASMQGKLTLYDTTGAVVGSPATFTLPVRTFVLQSTSALGVAANKAGSAVFTYLGPPGVITADTYFINGAATVIVPSKFEPRALVH